MANPDLITDEEDIHVLLVEDHPPTQKALSKLMESVGVKVRCVSTVKEGIEELANLPTLVVLDLLLPDGNGIEVLTEIRKRSLQSKVVIVTGAADEGMLEKVRELNPSVIFQKPLDMDDFISWICEPAPQEE